MAATLPRSTQLKVLFNACKGGFTDVDFAHFAAVLHAAGGVYSFAPNVVLEFLHADDAGHHRIGMNADADLAVS